MLNAYRLLNSPSKHPTHNDVFDGTSNSYIGSFDNAPYFKDDNVDGRRNMFKLDNPDKFVSMSTVPSHIDNDLSVDIWYLFGPNTSFNAKTPGSVISYTFVQPANV